MTATRRQFLRSTILSGAGLAIGTAGIQAIEPINRDKNKSHIRLSIAAYGYRKYLDLKIKPKPPMDLMKFIGLAAEMGLDAVELTEYYFQETSQKYLAKLKSTCTRLGLDVSGTAIKNDFGLQDKAMLQKEIDHVKKWVEYSSVLGAKTMRIFAGRIPKGDTGADARKRCIAAVQECCEHAIKYGIYLALENHPGIASTYEETKEILDAIKQPAGYDYGCFGFNWDDGNFRSENAEAVYADLAKLAPYAVTCQLKIHIQPKGKKQLADLPRIIGILRKANYRGYLALEYEAEEDPMTAIPKHVKELQDLLKK